MKQMRLLRTSHLKSRRTITINAKINANVSNVSNTLFYLGLIILLSALIYMIANLYKADSIIRIWFPFMIGGVILVFMSQMIKWQFSKL